MKATTPNSQIIKSGDHKKKRNWNPSLDYLKPRNRFIAA
jgi:hypothetical protein